MVRDLLAVTLIGVGALFVSTDSGVGVALGAALLAVGVFAAAVSVSMWLKRVLGPPPA